LAACSALITAAAPGFKVRGEKIKLSQEVACIVLGGKWLNPHLAENDALMLSDCFLGLSKLLAAAASLSFSELSQISFSQLLSLSLSLSLSLCKLKSVALVEQVKKVLSSLSLSFSSSLSVCVCVCAKNGGRGLTRYGPRY
jgi:hypothetical protein